MLPFLLIGFIAASIIGYVLFKPSWVRHKRKLIAAQPFPKQWRTIIKHNVPYFHSMPADLQLQLKQHVLIFLNEKQFYGFEGIEINDEIKTTIAVQACLLLLNRQTDYYPKLKSIYVYPSAFITSHQSRDAAGVVHENRRVLSGESWDLGKVILSWTDTKEGAADISDGRNVDIHEFAHQLDQETGTANGAPYLRHKSRHCWSDILSQEYEKLRVQTAQGKSSLMDKYGASNPAEFFAVASEVFFEQPQEMLKFHPELYQQLHGFYHVNPAIWL